MKISAHFFLEELVGPDIFNQFGDRAIQFLDMKIVNILEYERILFGKPITVNNWHTGGSLKERGFRNPYSSTGGKLSQHKFGRAVDRNIEDLTPQEHYAAILKNPTEWINRGLTTLEDINSTSTWCHSDVRNTSGFTTGFHQSGILIVQP